MDNDDDVELDFARVVMRRDGDGDGDEFSVGDNVDEQLGV